MLEVMKFVYGILILIAVVGFSSCSSDEKIVVVDSSGQVSGQGDNDNSGDGDNTSHDGPTVAKRVLIEDYVATWCGNCILPIEKSEQADKSVFVPVAIHFLGSQLQNEAAIRVAQENSVSSQTTVIVDKHTSHSFRNDFNAGDYPKASLAAIAMDSQVSGSTLGVNLRFKFYKKFTDLKYTVYLCENNVIAPQANYQFSGSIYESSPRNITNFNHNHVLQQAILGEVIPNENSGKDDVYEVAQSFDIGGKNSLNLEVIVYVETGKEVLNTQIVKVGQNVDFHAEIK
ncbi:hypothetical protein EMN47_16655 [Prolixibacteraceae bacterium JC049]|nr:hypothetical protein [Prolixibacteraceae bacterium JC049]